MLPSLPAPRGPGLRISAGGKPAYPFCCPGTQKPTFLGPCLCRLWQEEGAGEPGGTHFTGEAARVFGEALCL